jgi:hypothetical protein
MRYHHRFGFQVYKNMLMEHAAGHGKLVEAGLPDQLLDKIQLHENLRWGGAVGVGTVSGHL